MRLSKPRAKPLNRRPVKRSKPCAYNDAQVQNAHQYATTQVNLGDCTDADYILCCILASQLWLHHKHVLKYEDTPHITVRYGLHDTPGLADHVTKILGNTGPITATVGNLSIFQVTKPNGDKFDVLKLTVRSLDLKALNTTLGLLPNHQDFEYDPHITIAYLKAGIGSKYLSLTNKLRDQWLIFNQLRFKTKDKVETIIPLSSTNNLNPSHVNQPRSWMGRYVPHTGIPRRRVVRDPNGNISVQTIDMSDELNPGSGIKQHQWNAQQREEIISLLKERLVCTEERCKEINDQLHTLCKVS